MDQENRDRMMKDSGLPYEVSSCVAPSTNIQQNTALDTIENQCRVSAVTENSAPTQATAASNLEKQGGTTDAMEQDAFTVRNPLGKMRMEEFPSEDLNVEEHRPLVEDNQDLEQDILEPLSLKNSEEYRFFQGPINRYVQFLLPTGQELPSAVFNPQGASIRMAVFGRPVATKVVFDIAVRNVRDFGLGLFHPQNLIHMAILEFDLHDREHEELREVFEFTFKQVFTSDDAGNYCDPCYIDICFKTKGGISSGLKHNNGKIDHATRQLLDLLYTYTSDYSQETRELHVRMPVPSDDVAATGNWLNTLEYYSSNSLPEKRAWFPYRSRNGELHTRFGQLKLRALVREAWDDSIQPVPPANYFHDLDEGIIKLAHGAHLEWRVGTMQFQRLLQAQTQIAFIVFGDSTVYAVVKINKTDLNDRLLPLAIQNTDLMIANGTRAEMRFLPEDEPEIVTCHGIVVPDYANIGTGDIHIAVYGKAVMRFEKQISRPNERLRFMDASLTFEENTVPLRRQMNALTLLRETSRWHKIFLNHEPSQLPDINPFDGLESEQVNTAFKKVLALKSWNTEQKAVFHLAKKLKGGFGFVEGFPGCGKSTTLAALAILYHLAGLHVLIVGPSNASVDAVTEKLVALIGDIDYVRVRQAQLEGPSSSGCSTQDQKEEAVTNMNTIIAALLRDIKDSYQKRIAGDQRYTVVAHVKSRARAAIARKETLMVSQKFTNEVGEIEEEEFDAYSFFCTYISDPPQRPDEDGKSAAELAKWEEAWGKFQKAYNEISKIVITETKILACTDNLAGSELVRKHFAADPDKKSQGIIIIGDEDGQALETNAWIPIVSLTQAHLVKGTIRGGDRCQLPPLVASSFGTPCFNEFSGQLGRSLFDRLLQVGFPVTTLCVQHRMHPTLASFPSQFTYQGRMKTDSAMKDRPMRPELKDGLITWLQPKSRVRLTETDLHLIGIDVENGETEIEPRTRSRFNVANVKVVLDLLSHLLEKGALGPESDLTIIAPYAEQRSRYVKALVTLAAEKQIRWTDMVKVATVDSMQGHESECVILDWVISRADTAADLGFTLNNNRCNVALTRAKQCLIVVGKGAVTAGEFKQRKQKNEDKKEGQLIAHWTHLFCLDTVYTSRGG